jgi:hypothetical protein
VALRPEERARREAERRDRLVSHRFLRHVSVYIRSVPSVCLNRDMCHVRSPFAFLSLWMSVMPSAADFFVRMQPILACVLVSAFGMLSYGLLSNCLRMHALDS